MTETCRRILSPAGYKCLTSNNALEALNLLGAERPDLLLTDLRMPEMDGMEMLRRAREIDPQMPVVLLTAHATLESAVAAVKAGAFDYLAKPFSIDQLKARGRTGTYPAATGAGKPPSARAAARNLRL